jgi:LysR family transcriptional regulator, hydrogen peroxide-inducible genes activator
MTLQELRYLVALADHSHFGRAAQACHISQPTLSTQIRKLEEQLGVSLFERTNKSVHVTAAGQEVVARARRILADTDAILDAGQRQSAPLAGAFRLGIIPTLGPYMLPWLVPALRREYPALRLSVQEEMTSRLLESLAAHRLDAALLALPVSQAGLESKALFDEPFWLAMPRGDKLAKGKPVTEEELRGQPLLLLTEGHCLRDQALAICGSFDAENSTEGDFRATNLETIRQMVATGMGRTLLPAMATGNSRDSAIALRPLAAGLGRRIGLVWRRSYTGTDNIGLLAKLIARHLPRGVHRV